MLKVKLSQVGKKHERSYRVVIAEARSKRDGRSLEKIGHYNPQTKHFKINQERLSHWLKNGAQMTETVRRLVNGNQEEKK